MKSRRTCPRKHGCTAGFPNTDGRESTHRPCLLYTVEVLETDGLLRLSWSHDCCTPPTHHNMAHARCGIGLSMPSALTTGRGCRRRMLFSGNGSLSNATIFGVGTLSYCILEWKNLRFSAPNYCCTFVLGVHIATAVLNSQ